MTNNLPDIIRDTIASESDEVAAMVERINKAIYDRAIFERSMKPNGSHIEMRRVANAFADNKTCAAFFVHLGCDPNLVFNRVRKDGFRSDLKGLQKIKKLFDYIMGRKDVIDVVSKALFASSIVAAKKGVNWLASEEQELILSNEKIGSLPKDVQSAIRDYQHKHMSLEGDSRPQSCRHRTTFSNLGMYDYSREEFDNSSYSLGINVDLDNPIIQCLAERWGL